MEKQPLLRMEDVHISFFTPAGEVQAARGVSYTLDEGETLGIVGESGSGKSVSVSALMKLLSHPGQLVGGRIFFEGRDINTLSKKEINRLRGKEIAMIFQDPMTSLNPVYTIGNQLNETILAHFKISGAEASERSIRLLSQVGINNPAKRMKQYPHELSGGMRQRVMIAMALSCAPKLLIADEPTTALDVTIQAQILTLMKKLQEETGTAILLITHDLGIVTEVCRRVMIMYAGKIVETGSVEDIFHHAVHPYTKGLLACLPKSGGADRSTLHAIEGSPVDLLDLPPGCAFAPRCSACRRICLREEPPRFQIADGHEAACWLLAEGLA